MRKQYTPRTAILTIGIMLLSTTVFSGPAAAEENISRGEMPRYCKMEAASSFSVSAQDVITLPAESDHGMFTVYGQTPAQGQDALFFTCTFNAQGQFVGVDISSDNRSGASSANAETKPSFDCAKASNDVEKLICSDSELAGLDRSLSDLYGVLYKNLLSDQQKHLKTEQVGWVKGRNECWKSDDLRGCVKGEYESRIGELKDR